MNSRTFAEATGRDGQDDNAVEESSRKKTSPSYSDRLPRRVRSSNKSASAFRTISEVADELNVQQHVLRFWESKFSQIRPLKRGGGRRFYRPEDIDLLKSIHHMLYTEGYTIKGVQKLLKEKGKRAFIDGNQSNSSTSAVASNANEVSTKSEPRQIVKHVLGKKQRAALQETLVELKELRQMVSDV
ncbi:MAG: MerR family transcriptional regulator [Micavibrio sp.]|nr:MerR family transcriptional regulator [Micavibrio sp.]